MDDADVSFGRAYGLATLVSRAAAVGLAAWKAPTPASFGLYLTQPNFLLGLFAVEIFNVFLAKRLTGHERALSLPVYSNAVRGDPSKGPILRRVVLRFKKLVFRLKPYQRIVHGLFYLFLGWLLIAYVTVCFGAPAFSAHYETAAFSALLAVLALLPALLVCGPEPDLLHRVVFVSGLRTADPLAHLLYVNGLGAAVGAWLGAFPIPLDWDRPWQAWPITCCVGAVLGGLAASLCSFLLIASSG